MSAAPLTYATKCCIVFHVIGSERFSPPCGEKALSKKTAATQRSHGPNSLPSYSF